MQVGSAGMTLALKVKIKTVLNTQGDVSAWVEFRFAVLRHLITDRQQVNV